MARLSVLTRTISLILVFLHFYSSAHPSPSYLVRPPFKQQQISDSLRDIDIRPATGSDLDDITTVLVDAFAPSELYHYVFPNFDREMHWICTRKAIGETMAMLPTNAFLNVISVPGSHAVADRPKARADRVVAVAGWIIVDPYPRPLELEDTEVYTLFHKTIRCSQEHYTNKTRAKDYSRNYDAIEKRYVRHFPLKQFYLGILATHPDWDGHGFGAANVLWGLEIARSLNIPTTLMATPAGWPLYDSLGFDSLANLTITTLDYPVDLWYEYMRYEVR